MYVWIKRAGRAVDYDDGLPNTLPIVMVTVLDYILYDHLPPQAPPLVMGGAAGGEWLHNDVGLIRFLRNVLAEDERQVACQ